MYWDVNVSIKRLLERIPLSPLSVISEGRPIVLTFFFGAGNQISGLATSTNLRLFKLVFSTVFYGIGWPIKTDTIIERVVRCRNIIEARQIAKAMEGEEVYANEYINDATVEPLEN